MRTLVSFLFFFFSINAFSVEKNKSIFNVMVKGHYGTQQTDVLLEGSEWVCKTELTPYHLSHHQPISELTLKKLNSLTLQKALSNNCRKFVYFTDERSKQTKKISGCSDKKIFADMLEELNRNCGRN